MNPIPFPAFKAELLRLYDPPHRAPATRAKLQQVLDLVAKLGVESTADLTPVTVARLIESRPPGQSPRTLSALLRSLRTACNYAVSSGYLRVSPFAVRPVASWTGRLGAPVVKAHHSREDIRRVLELMRQATLERKGWAQWRARRLYAMTTLFAYTGLRRNEGLFLHVEDLDLEARVVWIRDRADRRLKVESAAQPVPLPAAAVPILRDWLEHRLDRPPRPEKSRAKVPSAVPWLFPNVRLTNCWTDGFQGYKPLDRLAAVGKQAGVEGLTFHSLRRSLATHLEGFVAQPMITRILRHTSERITQTWYQASDIPNLRAAMDGFDF
jgi:integrase